jgi:hypothetical protein
MATFDLAADFEAAVKGLAEANEWEVAESDKDLAVIEFETEGGDTMGVFIARYDDFVEFTVPSVSIFESEEEIPHEASTYLLQRNSELPLGFWCMETSDDGAMFYSIMHNEPLGMMDGETFADIVTTMLDECEEFDDEWETGEEEGEDEEEDEE